MEFKTARQSTVRDPRPPPYLTFIGVQTQAPPTVAIGASSGQIPQTNQSGQQPQQIPSNLASGAGAFDPFAGLTGARYAGQVPLPNISMFGPDRIPCTSNAC